MQHGTGLVLPRNINDGKAHILPADGVLMQIVSLAEIGHSALSLQNVRETRINREGMDEEAARIAEEDEGPLEDYPRRMLKMELSDGATSIQAIEYKRLPELVLGKTPLGHKVSLIASPSPRMLKRSLDCREKRENPTRNRVLGTCER